MRHATILAAILAVAAGTGCNATHWLGESAGEAPGFEMRGGGVFDPPRVKVTSDCHARAKRVKWTNKDGSSFEMEEPEFGQMASDVVREEPAKIAAVGEGQRGQAEYVAAWLGPEGLRGIVSELVPIFSLLAAAQIQETTSGWQFTLPNGMQIGRERVTHPAQLQEAFSKYAQIFAAAPRPAPPTSQPTSQPAEDSP